MNEIGSVASVGSDFEAPAHLFHETVGLSQAVQERDTTIVRSIYTTTMQRF